MINFIKSKRKWLVRLTIGGERIHIGWSESYEEASLLERRKLKQIRRYDPDSFHWRGKHAKVFAGYGRGTCRFRSGRNGVT